jgi:hypothetical protein
MNIGKDAKALEASIAARVKEIQRQHQYEKAIRKARAELRDRFAGYALIGLLASDANRAYSRDEMAAEAWKQADAMMKARDYE